MNFSLLAVATLLNGFLIGFLPTLVDGLKPSLKARFNLSDERIAWFGRLFFLTWLPAMPLAGWLLDLWPNREILLYGGLLPLILGMAWLALTRSAPAILLNAVVLGAAYATLATATVRLMTVAFFPEPVDDPTRNIASLNLGFVAVAVGAIFGPYVTNALERWCGFRQGLLYLSIAGIVPAVVTALCERRLFPAPQVSNGSLTDLFTHPHLVLVAAVLLIYFALENSLEYWPDAYLKEIGYEGRGLQVGLFIFWICFILARGAAAWWLYLHPHQGFAITLILLATSALILGNLAGGFEFGSGSFGFWLLGACYGPLLPGFLGIAFDLYPRTGPLPSSILGFLLALSGLDTLIARSVLNVLTKGRTARTIMRLPTILALIACAVLVVLAFIRN